MVDLFEGRCVEQAHGRAERDDLSAGSVDGDVGDVARGSLLLTLDVEGDIDGVAAGDAVIADIRAVAAGFDDPADLGGGESHFGGPLTVWDDAQLGPAEVEVGRVGARKSEALHAGHLQSGCGGDDVVKVIAADLNLGVVSAAEVEELGLLEEGVRAGNALAGGLEQAHERLDAGRVRAGCPHEAAFVEGDEEEVVDERRGREPLAAGMVAFEGAERFVVDVGNRSGGEHRFDLLDPAAVEFRLFRGFFILNPPVVADLGLDRAGHPGVLVGAVAGRRE